MAGDVREALDDVNAPHDVNVLKPRMLAPLDANTAALAALLASSAPAPSPSKPGSLLTRVEIATGEATNPAAALIRFAHHVAGRYGNPRATESPLQRMRTFSRPGTTTSSSASLRGGSWTSAASVSTAMGPLFAGGSTFSSSCSSAPGGKRRERMSNLRHGLANGPPVVSEVPRPTCTVRPQAAWVVTPPRWVVSARASLFPSVRAYSQPPDHRENTAEGNALGSCASPASEYSEKSNGVRRDASENSGAHRHRASARRSACDVEEATAEISLPWNEDELREVFDKFSDDEDQELQTELLPTVLRYLGARCDDDEVEELINAQTQYASLDFTEFIVFTRSYREHDITKLREMFEHADVDSSGDLDFDELQLLLVESGYTPTVEASKEAMQMIDEDDSGTINWEEFEQLREHLRVTRGFLKAEAAELSALFQRAAGKGNSLLLCEDVWRVSTYLGFPFSREDVQSIIASTVHERTDMVTFDELLKIIRGIKDFEKDKTQAVFRDRKQMKTIIAGFCNSKANSKLTGRNAILTARHSKDSAKLQKAITEAPPQRDGKEICGRIRKSIARPNAAEMLLHDRVARQEVQLVLSDIGYWVPFKLVQEILSDVASELESEEFITLDEVSLLLNRFRYVEGFTHGEVDDLWNIFKKEQKQSAAGANDSACDALELGRVLRWLGIGKTLPQVQQLIEEIDFDGNGEVEFDEFKKLMRGIMQSEARQRRLVFLSFEKKKSPGMMNTSRLHEAFERILGAAPNDRLIRMARLKCLVNEDELSLVRFEAIFAAYRAELVQTVRENAGYIPQEVEHLRQTFQAYDKDKSGTVERDELRRMIAETIPEATWTKDGQEQMQKLLQEISPQDPRCLNFNQFLWLSRRCHDQRDEQDIVHEEKILQELQFSPEEVEGYRALFSHHVNWMGELSLEALTQILKNIHKITLVQEEELAGLVRKFSLDRREAVRFPQFLKLVHKMIQEDWGGLNAAVERVIKLEALTRAEAAKR